MNTINARARAYLSRMAVSVAGRRGHSNAFKAAVTLMRGFALSFDEAYILLAEWNTKCQPPWSEAELRHKLKSAASSSSQPLGFLLGKRITPGNERLAPDFENDFEKKARQRKAWPAFNPLTPPGIRMIAQLRGNLPDAVDLAHRLGFLKGAWIDGHRCFIIHEGTFAQARRFDGVLINLKNGKKTKAKNLPGSEGAFIGSSSLGEAGHVLLVEGAIGLLEAYAALLLADSAKDWVAIASTSAYSRLTRDQELLKRLAGRHVRIVADLDEAGMDGAATWLADLEAVGCTVEAFTMPEGCKDLGDLLRKAAELYIPIINELFQ